ncbi:enoyl-CoA hydratase/carnithine racemase [Bradyrhizobium sp. LM2.7]
MNIFGPKHLPLLNHIITAIETDPEVKVVVFDSAVEGFFITHYDFLAPLQESLSVPPVTDRPSGAARYAGTPQPRAGGVHCLDPGPRDRRR